MTKRSGLHGYAARSLVRRQHANPWHLRQHIAPPDNRPPTCGYGALMPSAADRVRFAAFVTRALRSARERGMTDRTIHAATGVNPKTFHRWQNGAVAPNVETVRKFCEGVGASFDEALAALGFSPRTREATPPAPIDPDVLELLRKLADPRTNAATRAYIRRTIKLLNNLPADETAPRRRHRQDA